MKNILLWAAVVAVVLLAAASAQNSSPTGPSGRYQLLSGEVVIAMQGGAVQQKTILRIDTTNGKTWEYTAGQGKDGQFSKVWAVIPE